MIELVLFTIWQQDHCCYRAIHVQPVGMVDWFTDLARREGVHGELRAIQHAFCFDDPLEANELALACQKEFLADEDLNVQVVPYAYFVMLTQDPPERRHLLFSGISI